MNIIICNDDGVNCKGLIALAERLSKKHNVLVVAPDGNRSASSHSITISGSIKLNKVKEEHNLKIYSISGTPVDCLKFAKLFFSDFNADIVLSGINKGHNIGTDVLYSGTLSIAIDASFFGNIAFAFSAYSLSESDFDSIAIHCENLINYLLPQSKKGDIWNINFPDINPSDFKGCKITPLGKHLYSDRYEKIGNNEYKLVGEIIDHNENVEDCDVEWIKKGYITITPILLNKTNYKKIESIKNYE